MNLLPHAFQAPASILLILGGLVACFAGYRLFRGVLAIYGFILGALMASSAMAGSNTAGMILAALAGGLVGALIMLAAYFVGVALAGAGLGALAVHLIWTQVGGEPHPAVVAISAMLGAVIAWFLQRYFIIASTAVVGAWTFVVGVATLLVGRPAPTAEAVDVWVFYPLHPSPGRPWVFVAWVVMTALGVAAQLNVTGQERKSRKKAKRR